MNDGEFDRLLRDALMDANLKDFQIPRSNADDVDWSLRYQSRRKKLLANPQKWYQSQVRPLWKKALRGVACLALACSLSLVALMSASPTIRAAVLHWVQEQYESHIVYRYQGEPSDEAMPEYQIAALPEGFAESNRVDSVGYLRITYENNHGQLIFLRVERMESGSALSISTEKMEVSDIKVNGHSGQYYHSLDPQESSAIVWIDEEANLLFTIDAFQDKLSLLHMAESVILVKTPI